MKIAMFSDTYLPQVNGVATSISLFRHELERMGHEVYVVAPVAPPGDDKVLVVPGFTFAFEKQHRIALPNLLEIVEFLEYHRVDLIHSHDPFSLGFRAIRAAKVLGLPHVHTYHTLLVKYRHYIPPPLTPTEAAVKAFSKWFCNNCHVVIAPTEAIRDELLSYGVNVPIHVVPTGIDVESFEKPAQDVRKKYGIPLNRKILLFVGRLAKEKNVLFTLEVFREVSRELDVHLLVVGDGPLRDELEKRVRRLKLGDRVTLTGYLRREEVIDHYICSDLFVFASVTETQGLVVLESLAAGTPVVAVAKAGVADVLVDGQGCVLLDEPDLKRFVKTVKDLLQSQRWYEEQKMRAKAYVEKHWSMRAVTRRLLEVYGKALELVPKQENPPMLSRLGQFAESFLKVFGGDRNET